MRLVQESLVQQRNEAEADDPHLNNELSTNPTGEKVVDES